jgi:hypothetical protein
LAGLRLEVNATTFSPVTKRKPTKAWVVYKLAKVGKRLGVVHGETETEALREAYKQFNAKTEAERRRIYLRAQ